jgi:hypothetical protein
MSERQQTGLALALIALAAAALYWPFFGNPPVFDDRGLYSGYRFYDFATAPIGLGLRHPPYFTFAFVEMMLGGMWPQRAINLLLHAGCGWALFALVREFRRDLVLPLAAGLWFVLHPVAVYGAGYLVQRSSVMATLFGVVSMLVFVRGLKQQRYGGALAAAVAYSLAVLSKEHAILLAGAVLAAAPLALAERRFTLRYCALYAAACVPAAVMVVLLSKGIIGTAYEPQFESVTAEVGRSLQGESAARTAEPGVASPWVGSLLTQAALFFRYASLWLLPTAARMSIDLKVDFAALWAPAIAVPAVLGFAAWGALGAFLVLRRGRGALIGLGLLYFWINFLVEFTVIRYQEPFVLYRSYLWAPGLALALAGAAALLPRRIVAVALLVAAIALPWQSFDRLRTFSSGLALWEDAASKLPEAPVPGGARTLYMLGREYLVAERPADAVRVVGRCIKDYPLIADCHLARGSLHMAAEEFEAAIPYFVRAVELQPKAGGQRHHLGWALENLGCVEQARVQYRISADLGYVGGAYRLMALDSPGKGLIGMGKKKPRGPCPPAIRSATLPPG